MTTLESNYSVSMSNLIDADVAQVRPVWSILSKGKTGTGKTILSCGKEFRPVYVFDLDGRMESVINYYKKLDGHAKGIYYNSYAINTRDSHYQIKKRIDELITRPEFKTVAVASLTSYIHVVMKTLQLASVKKDGSVPRQKGGITVNVLEDFNFEDSDLIYTLIAGQQEMKMLGMNSILEVHITPYEIYSFENGERVTLTLNQILTKGKKAPAQIPNYYNEVWLFEKEFEGWSPKDKKIDYYVNPAGTPTDECKTSFGIAPFKWTNEDPTIHLVDCLSTKIKETPRASVKAVERF